MIHIYTFAHKRPDFIGLQAHSFRRYLREPFRFTVFNNAAFDPDVRNFESNYKQIHEAGYHWCDEVVNVEKDPDIIRRCEDQEIVGPMFKENGQYHNPNVACAYPLCWAWSKHISKVRENICIIDSDIFLTHPVSFSDQLKDNELCYIPQQRAGADDYAWNAFFLANMNTLPEPETLNWYCGRNHGVPVDVGGQTSTYFKAHPEVRKMVVDSQFIDDDPTTDFHPTDYEIMAMNGLPFALHYRSGSNWRNYPPEYLEKKLKWLHRMLGD